jgi:hypothetical protein
MYSKLHSSRGILMNLNVLLFSKITALLCENNKFVETHFIINDIPLNK